MVGCLCLFSFQTGQPIPPNEGDETHKDQPKWCQNYDGKFVHNCSCKNMEKKSDCDGTKSQGGESSSCSVYCRKSACKCVGECETR